MQLISRLKDLVLRLPQDDVATIVGARDSRLLLRDETCVLVEEVVTALESGDFNRVTVDNSGQQCRITYVDQGNILSTLCFDKNI